MVQDIGTFSYVSYQYILAGCKADLGLRDTTIEDVYIIDNINLGLRELKLKTGSNAQAIAILPIDPITKSAKVPQGFIEFTQRYPIVYCDAAGNAVNGVGGNFLTSTIVDGSGGQLGSTTVSFPANFGNFSGPVFTNNTFFKNSPYGTNFNLNGTMTLDANGIIWFSSNVDAEFIKISFWGSNLDLSTGEILIPQYCERALRCFANSIYCITNEKPQAAYWDGKWANAKLEVRAIANRPDSNVMAYINQTMKSLI